jgi:hypothetical protein
VLAMNDVSVDNRESSGRMGRWEMDVDEWIIWPKRVKGGGRRKKVRAGQSLFLFKKGSWGKRISEEWSEKHEGSRWSDE